MYEKMPNGRDCGGRVMTQSEIDDLQKRQTLALESIAKSLAKIAGGDFKVTASTKPAETPKSFFGQVFG